MRIRRLRMQNFRGFEDATVDLERPLTVLFGVNGSGKSSVLAACAIAFSDLLYSLIPQHAARPWGHAAVDTDIRRGAQELSVTGTGWHRGLPLDLLVTHRPGRLAGDELNMHFLGTAGVLFVFYEAARNVAAVRDAFSPQENGSGTPSEQPFSAMHDALVVGSLRFRSFFQWFKAREDAENELKVSKQDLALEDSQLAAVRRAVAGMLPGFAGLRMQRDPLHMVIRKGDEVLAVDQLSDGEKLLVVLSADLARRLAIVYADSADPLQGEAVVLIDEIELHLHPAWQRRVLGALRRTFPGCQFIVTTHSPQVISEVPNDAVVLVDGFQFMNPGTPTAGRDSNAILEEAMGTPERPQAERDAIRAISALLDEGKHAEARAKLDALAEKLSEQDREIVGLRTMLHFMEGGDEVHPQGG